MLRDNLQDTSPSRQHSNPKTVAAGSPPSSSLFHMRRRERLRISVSGPNEYNSKRGINYRISNSSLLYQQCLAAAGLPYQSAIWRNENSIGRPDGSYGDELEDAEHLPARNEQCQDTHVDPLIPGEGAWLQYDGRGSTANGWGAPQQIILPEAPSMKYEKRERSPRPRVPSTPINHAHFTSIEHHFSREFINHQPNEPFEQSSFTASPGQVTKPESGQIVRSIAESTAKLEPIKNRISNKFKRLGILRRQYNESINDHIESENLYLKELEEKDRQLERLADQRPFLPGEALVSDSLAGKFRREFKLDIKKPLLEKKPKNTCVDDIELQKGKLLQKNLGSETIVDKFNIEITGEHLKCLLPEQWLNDEIINFYLSMLQDRNQEDLRTQRIQQKCWIFNTFFFEKLVGATESSYNYAAVKRWTARKKVDIFDMHLVLVPINIAQTHWVLGAIDMRPGFRKILLYDSLNGKNTRWFSSIRRYLIDEHLDKKGQPLDSIDEWEEPSSCSSVPNTPVQHNSFDCGVFVCQFAECLSAGREFDFSQKHVPEMRIKMTLQIAEGCIKT